MASIAWVSFVLAVFILLYIGLAIYYFSTTSIVPTWPYSIVVAGLAACTIPAIVGLYGKMDDSVYSFQDYAVQIYLPVVIGFALLFALYRTILPDSVESFLIMMGSISILFSTASFSYILLRMKYAGT